MENGKGRLVICSQNKKRRLEREEKSVPEDLVPDIISRLPAKDLMRFTSVSKSWRSFICTDPCFHRLQAQRTAPSDRQKPFLRIEVRLWTNTYWSYNNYWTDLSSIEGNNSFDLESIEGHSIYNPFGGDVNNQVLDSCHGLLLHQQQPSMKLAVSNPTTKKHVMLPPNPAGDVNVVFCGFGYDRVLDCYKVVTKVQRLFELVIYDLKKGSWGSLRFGAWWRAQYCELDDIDELYLDNRDDDYELNSSWNDCPVESVDGGLYWCVDNGQTQREMVTIVCFLLAEEEFHVVELPDLGEAKYYPNLTVLDDRLCLVCQALDTRNEVWSNTGVDYDGDGKRQWRWTKLFAISDPYVSPDVTYREALIPVCFSASRNRILICMGSERLFWYDLEKKEFRKFSNLIIDLMVNPCVSRMGDLGFLLKNTLG